jgi:hypothetical protein
MPYAFIDTLIRHAIYADAAPLLMLPLLIIDYFDTPLR